MPEERDFSTIEYSADFGALITDLQTLYTAAQNDIEIFKALAESMEQGTERAKAAGIKVAETADAEAAAGERMTEAFSAMEARMQGFVKWASQLEGVKVSVRDLAVQIQQALNAIGSPLGRVNLQSVLEGAQVQAVKTAAATKDAFAPAILSPFEQKLQAITFQLEQMRQLERELQAIGIQKGEQGIASLGALAASPIYQGFLGQPSRYQTKLPSTMFESKLGEEGALTQFEVLQGKLTDYIKSLSLVRDAQDIITASVRQTGTAWETTSSEIVDIAAQIKMLEESIQAIKAGTSQVVAKNDEEATSVNSVVAARMKELEALREKQRLLIASAAQGVVGGAPVMSTEQLGAIPYHPSSFYKSPAQMATNLLRSMLEAQLQDPGLADAMMSAVQPTAMETTAQAAGKRMHTLVQSALEGPMMSFEEQFRMIDREGREWIGKTDVRNRAKKVVGDFKMYNEKALADLGEFSAGRISFEQLSTRTKGVVAQVAMYAKALGPEWEATVVRLPTPYEVVQKFAGKERAAVTQAAKAFKAGGPRVEGGLAYPIPLEKVPLAQAKEIMDAARAAAIETATFKEGNALIQTALELERQRVVQKEQLVAGAVKELSIEEQTAAAHARLAADAGLARKGWWPKEEAPPQLAFDVQVAALRRLSLASEARGALAGAGDVGALEKLNREEQRGIAVLERKVTLSKAEVELRSSKGYAPELTPNQIKTTIDLEERNLVTLKAKKKELEEINRVTREALTVSKAVQKTGVTPIVEAVPAVPIATMAETNLAAVQAKVTAAQQVVDLARQENTEAQRNLGVLNERKGLVATLTNLVQQQKTADSGYQASLEAGLAKLNLSTSTRKQLENELLRLKGREVDLERLRGESKARIEAEALAKASLQRVAQEERTLSALNKQAIVLEKQVVDEKKVAAQKIAAAPAVAANLAPYETQVAALIQAVEATSGKAREKALDALEKERGAYQRLIGQIQVGLAPLSKDAALKQQAADAATAHAKALDLDAQAAEKQLLLTLSSAGATNEQMAQQRVIADTKRNAAAAAAVNAGNLTKEAAAAQQLVTVQRDQQKGLTQLRTVMGGVEKQYGETTKQANSWQSRLFSLHRIIQVFWGSLLAQIAYGTMGAIQQFISGSADLFVKFEANLTRFQVAVRSTQRAVAEGFAGADITQTVGEFAGTVEQWTKDLDDFTKRWKVFTRQDALAGFKEFLNISRANNMGRELSLQLMDVAAALTLVEDEFANDLPRAMQAVARASDGYVRPMGATFIGMISDVDRNIKAMQIYGTVYSKLGEGNEALKKQQQVLVDTSVILERYNRVSKDTIYLYETIDLKIRSANARIQEQQIAIGGKLAPMWLDLKNALVGFLETLDKMAAFNLKLMQLNEKIKLFGSQGPILEAMTQALLRLRPVEGGIFAALVGKMPGMQSYRAFQGLLTQAAGNNKDQREMLLRWADSQILLQNKTFEQIIEILKKQGPKVILQAQATKEQFQGLVQTGKGKEAIKLYDDLAAKLAEARTEYARLVAIGGREDLIDAAKKNLDLLEAQVVALKQYSKTLSDADVVAQHLKDTMIDWTPEGAGIDVGKVIDDLEQAWDDYLEKRQDALDEKNSKLLESFNTFMDDLADADIKHGDNLKEIAKDTARDIVDAFRKAADGRVDAYRDMLDSIEGENEDYALRLKELDDKQLEDKEKARREHLQKLEDLEREHLRNLRDMQAQYEFDLTAAADERDARKVLELMRKHEFDVQQEGVHYGDRISDENRNFARQEAERKANDALERARLEREHKKRLEDIKLEYEHRLEEIKRALKKELEDIKEKEKQKVRDENERWARDKVDVAAKYSERNKDIAKWLEDQYDTIEKAYNKQVEAVLKGLNKQVEWTQDRMKKLFDVVKAALGPSGSITGVYDTWFAYIERRMRAMSAWQPPVPGIPSIPTTPGEPGSTPPGEPAKPPVMCNDPKALNFGKPGPCVYRPPGTGPQEQLSAITPTGMLPTPSTTTWTATSRLEIHVTADEHFSEGFEDALIEKITEVVRAI
jgi:hypothetical protein